MNNLVLSSATIGVVISLLAYQLGVFLKNKTKKAIFNPLLISIALVIIFLLVFDIEYESYNQSAKYLSYLLTPATVSLAIPLYRQLEMLKKNWVAVVVGITSGVFTSLVSVLLLSVAFGLTHAEFVTLLPKSITTAIGMGISEELGGYPTITVAVIIVTGIFGNMIAEFACKLFRIKHPISKGLAIGTSSHAMGTTKALELGQIEGAMSSLSIVVAGLMTVILASFFAMMY
ncbi:MAG: LrgB family protein [Faecalimonas sp.]|nr:LrgB family protein [Faecalimonas sp.]